MVMMVTVTLNCHEYAEISKSTLGCAQITLGCRNHWKLCIEGWFARIQGSEITILIIMHKCANHGHNGHNGNSDSNSPWYQAFWQPLHGTFRSTLWGAQITFGCRNHWKLCLEGCFAGIQGSEITIMIIMIIMHTCKTGSAPIHEDG